MLEGEVSAPHRIDAVELWHFYAGDPLELSLERPDGDRETVIVGPDLAAGQVPQVVVDAGVWQSARPLGRYSLVGATGDTGVQLRRVRAARVIRRDVAVSPPVLLGKTCSSDAHQEAT